MNLIEIKGLNMKEWANNNSKDINYDNDYYGNDNFLYERILADEDSTIYNVVIKENEIFDIFFISDFYGIPVIYPYWYNHSDNEELMLLFEHYPNSIINLGEYPNFELNETDIVLLNLNNGINTYCLSSCYTFVAKKKNEFILKDKFEEIFFFKEFSMSDIVFSYVDENELYSKLQKTIINLFDIPFWRTKYGVHSYCGFHYFSNEYSSPSKYLVASYKNNIVGIIKIGFYDGHYQAVDYIDVRIDFKNNGLGKKMIKELSNHLDVTHPLIVSEESEEGKKCHVFDMFKTYIKNNDVFKSSEYRKY